MWLSAALAVSCTSDGERPAPIVCSGDCGSPGGVRTGFPSDPSDGGAGPGGGGSDSGETVGLTGDVLLLLDNGRFDSGAPLSDTAEVKTTAADGGTVTDDWNGVDPFELAKLEADTSVWLLVTPRAGSEAAVTFEPVVTVDPDPQGRINANLAVVREDTIDEIFSVLSAPLQRDAGAAQVVLRLVQRGGGSGVVPIPGVVVQASGAEAVVYGVNGGYSDVSTETDGTGVVVLLNVPAAAWPGAIVNLHFSGAKTGGAKVLAVNDAVSLVTLAP